MKRSKFLCMLMICIPCTLCGCSRQAIELKASVSPDSSVSADLSVSDLSTSDLSDSRTPVSVDTLTFKSGSKEAILLNWSDQTDPQIQEYIVQRREPSATDWETLTTLPSDHSYDQEDHTYTDQVSASDMIQYEYRIQVEVTDSDAYIAEDGRCIYGSNILICVDPGHYSGVNYVADSDGYDYSEGDFTIRVAKELEQILKEDYGVTCLLTRTDGSITIDGYSDETLDSGHISLRGEAAEGCDLFFSIHTNANNDMANGYDTVDQPEAITKTVVLVNQSALDSDYALSCANAIGTRLSALNAKLGIAGENIFQTADTMDEMTEWTDSYNDQLDTPGTICYRTGDDGLDYYGVLRGSSAVGVPGFIVEHAFHTVQAMRKEAASGNLAEKWAATDAQGIAEGLDLEKNEEE